MTWRVRTANRAVVLRMTRSGIIPAKPLPSLAQGRSAMTWIVDDNGRRWVEMPARKRRASPKGRRFAEIKVGDWLEGGPWSGVDHSGRKYARQFYLVTDHWFDPVAGEEDAEKGMLFAIARLKGLDRETGEPRFESKVSHTRFGLASQGYHYSTVADPLGTLQATFEAVKTGEVVSIGQGKKRASHVHRI